jgi:hypothetical protein
MTQRQAVYRVARAPRVSEHDEQVNFLREVALRYGNRADFIGALLFAVPNGAWFGGKNPWALYAKFRAEGFKKGVADLLYLQPRGEYAYLAIEMKATDKTEADVSDEQRDFLAAVNAAGGTGDVCYGADEAMKIFSWYMSLPARS